MTKTSSRIGCSLQRADAAAMISSRVMIDLSTVNAVPQLTAIMTMMPTMMARRGEEEEEKEEQWKLGIILGK